MANTPASPKPQPTNGQRPTIYAIAELTGFNPSTVSRALHKPGRINEQTARVIHEAAASLGYRVNPLARALPTGRSGMLGLVVSDITNPVFFALIRGAEQAAATSNRMLVLAESQLSAELELERVERMQPAVDGFVLVASRLTDEQIADLAGFKPLVSANRLIPGLPSVLPQGDEGIDGAISHLATLGHRSVAFLSGPQGSWVSAVRWEQLLMTTEAHGMTAVEINCGTEITDDTVRRIVASGVTAVHTYNDLMAFALLRACAERGIAVPKQLSIIGHDDSYGSALSTPGMSTIHTPMLEIGRDSVTQLVALLDGVDLPEPAPYTTTFIPRGTTGPTP
ncbi:MAG: LacI family transcriptional regulator [Promicromonosporaceae bacterium]|nr:LacI family transcriptional regulator [Promicromonosporaceae bacterium]